MLDASAAVYGLGSPDEFVVHQPIGRLLEADEVAAAIVWLCSRRQRGHRRRPPGRRGHDRHVTPIPTPGPAPGAHPTRIVGRFDQMTGTCLHSPGMDADMEGDLPGREGSDSR